MTLRALVVAATVSVVIPLAIPARAQQTGVPKPDLRMQRLEHWLDAVFRHNPGLIDDRIVDVGKLSDLELQTLLVDATTVVRIIRTPNLATSQASIPFTLPGAPGQTPRPVRYVPAEVTRLKQLACAVGGLADAAPCEW